MSASSTQTQNTNTSANGTTGSTTNPWSVQQPYLTQAFSGASNAYGSTQSLTPEQMSMYGSMLGYGQNMSTPTSSANAGASLSNTGATGAATGVNELTGYNPASTNNANALQSYVNNYVANQNIPAQTQAAMQSANQEAAYSLNPQIDASAAGSGDINSSRDSIEHGLVASNLAQTAANTNAQLTANAENTGAQLGESALQSNNTNTLNAALGLTTGGGYDANAGTAANTGSVGQASGLYGISSAGATGQNTDPYQSLQNFYNIVGGNNWGSQSTGTSSNTGTSTGTTTYNPSQLAQMSSILGMVGSLI